MPTPAAQGPASRSTNRADLQSNLLADRIERWFMQIKPMLPWILAAIVAVAAVAIIISLISGQAARREAEGWSDIYFNQSKPDRLAEVATDFPGTSAGLWAKQFATDSKMSEALMQVYADRAIATQKLDECRAEYEQIVAESRDSMLTIRAMMGIAKSYDAQGKAELAVSSYQKILSQSSTLDEQLKQTAIERIAFIQSEQGKIFFKWFAENTKPASTRPTGAADNLNQLPNAATDELKFDTLNIPTAPDAAPETTTDAGVTEAPADVAPSIEPAPSTTSP
jgi:hypothetical protein